MSKTFLFQAIQFIQTVQFIICMPLVLFNPLIGPYQVLPRWARVNLGAMAMKGCSVFPKVPALLGPHHQTVKCDIQDTHLGGGSYPSAEVQSVYSTASADWAIHRVNVKTVLFQIIQFSINTLFKCIKTLNANHCLVLFNP